MNARLVTAVVFTFTALFRADGGEEKVVSRFTSTARAKAASFQEEGTEGDPGFDARFRGLGGYELELLAGDERSWLNIKFGDETVDLYHATMNAIAGTFPHKANDVVEWRGTEKNGRFVPCAIIYRIAAGNDETRKIHTRLVVIKLDHAHSTVIGSAGGKDEEAEAHRLADSACGKSR